MFAQLQHLRGSIFHFLIVSYEGECQLSGTFFRMEKSCSWPKLSYFQIAKIHTFTLCTRTFIAIPQESTLKSISSDLLVNFLRQRQKLGSYVLGTKTKLSFDQNFYLGLTNENIEFLKLPVAQNLSFDF